MKDEKRIEIIKRVFRGELTVIEAAMMVGISARQCYRIKRPVKELGPKGAIHGHRGRPCKRKVWRGGVFYKTERIASLDSKTTHALGLYRTKTSAKASTMDRSPSNQPYAMTYHPDFFTLLLI
jgi:hypothetical protein